MNETTIREDVRQSWPPLIGDLREADGLTDGLSGRILKCEDHWVLFMKADRDVEVPVHRHGAQWGVVLSGTMELAIGDTVLTYHRGESHYIPAGVDHSATLYAGWQGMYIFRRQFLESLS